MISPFLYEERAVSSRPVITVFPPISASEQTDRFSQNVVWTSPDPRGFHHSLCQDRIQRSVSLIGEFKNSFGCGPVYWSRATEFSQPTVWNVLTGPYY